MRACVVRIEGTNCEDEMKLAFEDSGMGAELVHLKQLIKEVPREKRCRLNDFDVVVFPGGWSAGDYVRAGAIFASRVKTKLLKDLTEFVEEGKLVLGVCNGFQVLVETGLLPGFTGVSEKPEAILMINKDSRFQCRPTILKHTGKCDLTMSIPLGKVMQVPVAHAEGRLSFGVNNEEYLGKLIDNDQIVFRYCMPDGSPADGVFPWNPNGSLYDIAGICNPEGNVLGLMPHPERVIHRIQHADWTRDKKDIAEGDGKQFFLSIADHLSRITK